MNSSRDGFALLARAPHRTVATSVAERGAGLELRVISPGERSLLEYLSVFPGTFTLQGLVRWPAPLLDLTPFWIIWSSWLPSRW
jgi:hypothetical protein